MKGLYGLKKINNEEDWHEIVGDRNWGEGKSAQLLASSWIKVVNNKGAFPKEVQGLIKEKTLFNNIKIIYGIIESPVELDTGRGQSMSDLMLYCSKNGKDNCMDFIIAVEGKADEPFGDIVEKWIRNGNDNPTKTRTNRLNFLNQLLGLEIKEYSKIKYQLIHRTASAILEAKKYGIRECMMLVHIFKKTERDYNKSLNDYSEFLKLFFKEEINQDEIEKGKILTTDIEDISLNFLWVQDKLS